MGYKISDIYQGGYSSFEPEQNEFFTGYQLPMIDTGMKDIEGNKVIGSRLGVSTDPRTANILQEVTTKLNPGQRVIELSLIDLGTPLDTITKQQMQEVRRLAELTGVEITVHGPIADASGITQQGNFNEAQREIVERKLINSIERSHELSPKGNIPVTFHTSNQLPGPHWTRVYADENDKKGTIVEEVMPVVNIATGQVTQVKREERYYPHLTKNEKTGKVYEIGKAKTYEVEERLENLNHTQWANNFEQLIIPKEHADKILKETFPVVADNYKTIMEGNLDDLPPEQKVVALRHLSGREQLRDIQSHVHEHFNTAFIASKDDEEKKKELIKISEDYNKKLSLTGGNPIAESYAIQEFMLNLKSVEPKIFKPVREYAMEKTAETYGKVALESYKKFKDSAPIVNIENPPAGGGLSTGKDLRELVEKAREEFEKKAVQEGILSASEAKKQSEKLLGVTWDVGHINQLRRFGYTGEDIIKEAGEVKKLVKHIHLSDNFGMDNIELPMGMGNVDFKGVMAKLGKNADQARKIVEAAHWWQFEKSSPVGVSMQNLGSPLYSMHASPAWNQIAGMQGGYFGGHGTTFPQINYETFGAGFSNLPTELGGQRQGGRGGRMSGNPME
jgi:hypothetical protein